MNQLALIHLLLALPLLALAAGTRFLPGLDRLFTSTAIRLFGDHVDESHRKVLRRQLLRSVHYPTTYRTYASRTLLFTFLAAEIGALLGVYPVLALDLLTGVVSTPSELTGPASDVYFFLASELGPLFVETLSLLKLFLAFLVGSALTSLALAVPTFRLSWWRPRSRASYRKQQINLTLPHAVSLMYALNRGGVPFPKILETISDNKSVYGEVGEEFDIAVRDMQVFGLDVFTAIRRMSEQTPSDKLSEFLDSLLTALRGGTNLSVYLYDHYERLHEEMKDEQETFLETLSAVAEAYVATLVAGPLLLVTILMVIGLVIQSTLLPLMVTVYFGIPLATVVFLIYLQLLMESPDIRREALELKAGLSRPETRTVDSAERGRDPEFVRANLERLDVQEGIRRAVRNLKNPLTTVLRNPPTLLYVTLPLAAAFLVFGLFAGAEAGALGIDYVDDLVVLATLLVVGTFAVVEEIHSRRKLDVESMVPVMLTQLASVNESGRNLGDGLRRLVDSELGVLSPEIERTAADLEWGGRVENAFYRLEDRLRTDTFTRATVLITNAMSAVGDLVKIIRISATDSRETLSLKVRRKQTMFTYLLVVYISFFIFLGIAFVLETVFVPAIPTAADVTGPAPLGVQYLGEVEQGRYLRITFHAVLVQAVSSGVVAGYLGEGDMRSGAKHVTVFLLSGYLLFALLA